MAHEMRHAFQSHVADLAQPGLLDRALLALGITEPPVWPHQGITREQG